ncbi:HNH endonuclease [Lacisediminihabitans sp. FW035]
MSERNRQELQRKFPDQPETDPEWIAPREPLPLTDEQRARLKKAVRSGALSRRVEYMRPDPTDVAAYAVWAASLPPTSSARKAKELARWFGEICQLCMKPIDMNLTGIHPGRWNVDHVTPISLGGEEVWGNFQLAHRGCNIEKSNLALPEPPPWLYARFCRAAIVRFEEYGLPERNPLERARYEAAYALKNLGIVTTNFEVTRDMGWDVSGFPLAEQKERVEKAIANVVRLQDRAIAKHDAAVR